MELTLERVSGGPDEDSDSTRAVVLDCSSDGLRVQLFISQLKGITQRSGSFRRNRSFRVPSFQSRQTVRRLSCRLICRHLCLDGANV